MTVIDAAAILAASVARHLTMKASLGPMAALNTLLQTYPREALALGGACIGFAFGFLAARANFCVMGAISDFRTFASAGRLGAVALAMATAIVVTQSLAGAGLIDLTRSMYLAPRFNWAGAMAGGLMFGAGMVYAGGCASRNLIRAGGGDIRAMLVVLTVAIAAFATISGVLGSLRAGFENATALDFDPDAFLPVSLDAVLAQGLSPSTARAIGGGLLALPLLAFAFARGNILREPANLFGGLGVGLLVSAGWLLTGMAYDEMALRPISPHSLSFVRPVGDAIDWLQRSTALGLPGFGAMSIFGTLLGSTLASLLSGHLRYAGFRDGADVRRHVGGALAMGIGGVLALGCSIGQGITGLSTLSLQSLLATASIFAGSWFALRRLEHDA